MKTRARFGRKNRNSPQISVQTKYMTDRKRRASQNNRLLRLIIERLREYDLEEVVIICNKFRKRRHLPPLSQDEVKKLFPPKE